MQELTTEIMVGNDKTAGPTVITIAVVVVINKPVSNRIKTPDITSATAVEAADILADSQTIIEAVDAEPKS